MAGKEATIYIVDCGNTMSETSFGRRQSNLNWALEYVWDKITTTVATGRKTTLVGVVGFRTDGTRNELEAEEEYQNITVFEELSQFLMPQLRKLRNELVVSSTTKGDAISALVIAISMIARTCKKLQYARKIVFVTDARSPMQADDLSQITEKLKEDNIELLILGVDFDDADYGFKEESKDAVKTENEAIFRTLCEDCNSPDRDLANYGTLAQAIDELSIPRLKTTKPVHSYRGFLTLGNPEEYETALSIDVERYPKVMVAAAPTASKFAVRSGSSGSDPTQSSATMTDGDSTANGGLAGIQNTRTYQVEDEKAAGGKREVPFDELAKGYEYGRTAVHISESDRNVTTFETKPGLDIIGFVEKEQYERFLDMSKTCMIVANRSNEKSSMALSALIHALYELDSYAVARFVPKEDKEPKILLLAPNIEPEFECLYDVELPFAEDVRSYKFPPLDRVVTVSGKVLSMHRNLPNDELQSAMSKYVDSMDLSNFSADEDSAEYAPMDEIYSPMLHRINQVVKHRAVHPDSNPPEPYEILTKYSRPPQELIDKSQKHLNNIIKAADVKKVPPKARGKRYGRKGRDEPKPLSELDVGALLAKDSGRQSRKIDPKNAIPEFKQIVSSADDISEIRSACQQLRNIVFDWVRHSVGDSGYGQAVEAIRVMREEMSEMEEPDQFNGFAKELKEKLLKGELGGERKEMWWLVRVNKLGLIQQREVESSDVTEEAAKAFLSASAK